MPILGQRLKKMMKILDEEQEALYQLKVNLVTAENNVKTATLQKINASLEYENALLRLYLKYHLNEEDQINAATGLISRKEEENDKENNSTDE